MKKVLLCMLLYCVYFAQSSGLNASPKDEGSSFYKIAAISIKNKQLNGSNCVCPIGRPNCGPNMEEVEGTYQIMCGSGYMSCTSYSCKPKTNPTPSNCVCPIGRPNCGPNMEEVEGTRQVRCGSGFISCPTYSCRPKTNPTSNNCVCPLGRPYCGPNMVQVEGTRQVRCGTGYMTCPSYSCQPRID